MTKIKTWLEDSKTLGELVEETRVLQKIEAELKEASTYVMPSV